MSPEKCVRPAKKSPGTQQMVKAESLDLRQDKILSPLLPHQAPICPLGLGWQRAKRGGGEGASPAKQN